MNYPDFPFKPHFAKPLLFNIFFLTKTSKNKLNKSQKQTWIDWLKTTLLAVFRQRQPIKTLFASIRSLLYKNKMVTKRVSVESHNPNFPARKLWWRINLTLLKKIQTADWLSLHATTNVSYAINLKLIDLWHGFTLIYFNSLVLIQIKP